MTILKLTRYFLEQLKELLDENRCRHLMIRQLTDFYSRFSPIALWLEDKEIISTSEMDEFFWDGLPRSVQKLVARELGLGTKIPPMKRAFKEVCHVIKAMLREDDDESDGDFFEWLSIPESNSATEEIRHDDAPIAAIEEDLQDLGKNEEDVVLGGNLHCLDEVTESIEDIEAVGMQGSGYKDGDNLRGGGDIPELDNVPAAVEDIPAVKNVPPPIKNLPAIERVLPTSIEEELAAFEEVLASNEDILEVNERIPAKCDEPPLPKDMSISYKIAPANEQVVFEASSIPQELLDSQVSYRLPISSFYRPTHQVFAYTKVRKKAFDMKTVTQRCGEDLCHFFEFPPSMSLCMLLDRSPGISHHFQLPGGSLELVMTCLLWNGYMLQFSSFYSPAHRNFAYMRVRKKSYHKRTVMRRHTEDFHQFFEHPLSVLLAPLLDRSLGVFYRIWLPEEGLELRIGCMVWNEEEGLEMAIFLRRDGMELETKQESDQIYDSPAVQAPSIAHDLQNMPEKSNGCQLISQSIKNQVSKTIRQQAQANDYLPKSDSLTIVYILSYPKNPSSPIKPRFSYQQQSSRPWILPAIDKEDSTIFTQKSASDFKSTIITYQIQRLSITIVIPGIGRRRFDEERNKSKVTSARRSWSPFVTRRGNRPKISDYG